MEKQVNEATDRVGNPSKDEAEENPPCDNCKKVDHDKELAERFCIKCEERLCISCSKEHKEKEEHLVVALDQHKESQKCKESNFCIDHDDELAELFCVSCKKVICSKCQKESHSTHSFSRVEDVADLVSKQTEAEYENLFDIQCHFDREREKLLSEKMKVTKTVKDMEAEIRQRRDEIIELVRSEANTLLKELDVFKKERLEEIEMEMRRMEEQVFTFKKFKEYCDRIKSNTNPRYTCEAEGVLRNIMDDLKTRLEDRWKSRLFSVEFSIQKTDIEQVLTSLGKLKIRCPYQMTKSCEVKLDEKEVYGIARLHDHLYVLSKSIFIHRLQHPFASVGEIKVPDFKSPKHIISCPKTSCLYIYDKAADCIWKVAVPSHQVSRYSDKVKEPTSLSVTSNAELLVLRNGKPVCLEVYNEQAILLRRLKLPATVPSLQYAREMPCGNYIGLGEKTMFKFRANGSIVSKFSECQDITQCFELSPYHIFLHSGIRLFNDSKIISSLSSLTLDIASHQDTLYKYLRTPVNSFYLKETKQLLVLEELGSGGDKTFFLSVYNVLPQ